jgi:LCP family protein required for cell wall assembly
VPEQPENWGWDLPPGQSGQPSDERSGGSSGSPTDPTGPRPGDDAGAQRAEVDEKAPGRHVLHPADDFRRTVLFTVAGAVVPGVGLLAAKRRVIGGVVLGIFLAVVLTMGIWAAVDRESLAALAVRPLALRVIGVVLVVAALLWVAVVVTSHLALRGRPTRPQRITGGVLVGILAFAVAAPLGFAANLTYVQASTINKVFKSDKDSKSATRPTLNVPKPNQTQASDPWANTPRLNVLLLGGDADKGREGTRTDTVILASIDTKTGDTTLFSLPRNTARMPFPAKSPLHKYYPNGFTNGNGENAEYFLNAMYRNVPETVPKDVLGETDNLGADALKLSVGAALGLNVDYYVLINLRGFTKLINALGGITLNINSYIPIGGNTDLHIKPTEYLHPGKDQHLDGRSALWYARGRYGSSDYARMDRQRCVINAIIEQANPANMLTRYEKIARAGGDIVFTDMPQEVLPLMVDLSLRVKDGNVRSIVFKTGSDGFVSARPNFPQMRRRVQAAIGEAKSAPSQPSSSATKPTKKATKKPESEDVADSCAYDAKAAESAQKPN